MAQPQVRASMTKDFLATLDEHWPEVAAQVRGKLPAEILGLIESTSRVGWLDWQDHLQLNDTARATLGPDRFRQAWRRAMMRAVESRTLRATVTGALRLFGVTPASLMRLSPRTYGMLIRHGGEVISNLHPDEKGGNLILSGFPEEGLRSGSFAEGLVGCFESYLDICETTGRVTLVSNTPAEGRVVYELSWR